MWVGAALGLALASLQAPAIDVADFAAHMARQLPRDMDDGTRIIAARAEGNVLVLVIDGPPGWRTPERLAEVTREVAAGMCDPGDAVPFVATRADTTEGEANPRRGTLVDRCPAAEPGD